MSRGQLPIGVHGPFQHVAMNIHEPMKRFYMLHAKPRWKQSDIK